jgi:hypothetical protein
MSSAGWSSAQETYPQASSHVDRQKAGDLCFYVGEHRFGNSSQFVFIEPVIVSKKVYEKYHKVLLSKSHMFKKISFVEFSTRFERNVRLPSYETIFADVNFFELTRYIKSEKQSAILYHML